jgi:hypothetical protein
MFNDHRDGARSRRRVESEPGRRAWAHSIVSDGKARRWAVTREERRLIESRKRRAHWKRWGPYVSDRAWGTVREDYSVVKDWLDGDPAQPAPPASRRSGRNAEWVHLHNADVLSMPDKWEYPW